MKLRADKVKELMQERGVSTEDLARAVERPGLAGDRADRAVKNWLRGSDHPRCKSEDVRAIAGALQASVPECVRFTTVLRYHRGSPRKARLLADLIRGKRFDEAKNLLTFTTKRAAVNMHKALMASFSEAEVQDADLDSLFVAESRVDEGPTMKRFQPKDRGRAHSIMKRTSHITIGLEVR